MSGFTALYLFEKPPVYSGGLRPTQGARQGVGRPRRQRRKRIGGWRRAPAPWHGSGPSAKAPATSASCAGSPPTSGPIAAMSSAHCLPWSWPPLPCSRLGIGLRHLIDGGFSEGQPGCAQPRDRGGRPSSSSPWRSRPTCAPISSPGWASGSSPTCGATSTATSSTSRPASSRSPAPARCCRA